MARRVFFTFHYQRDIMRVNTIRNHWLTKPDAQAAGYWDHSLWEATKKKGDAALKTLIDDGLHGSSVTAVLIGQQTAGRKWVKYEIEQSFKKGKGLLGIYIHNIRNTDGTTDSVGRNPFDDFTVTSGGSTRLLSQQCKTYNWVNDSGYINFSSWVEAAAKAAGK